MAKTTSKHDEWSDAKYHAFIVGVLRQGTRRYPPKYQCLNEAKTEKKTNPKTGRIAQHFKCALCLVDFPSKDVQVDHISPVVAAKGFTTWDTYIKRLYCSKENLQVLCTKCHDTKTLKEKGERNTS
jgi:5-methylcytosine-specific restriction endonuclease McrA